MKKQHNPPPPKGAKPPPPPAPPTRWEQKTLAAKQKLRREIRLEELQQQIADDAATDIVQCELTAAPTTPTGRWWWELPTPANARRYEEIMRALEYLRLRVLIEYSADGKLVRFVEPQP